MLGTAMPTPYEGREDDYDLGQGHSFVWMTDDGGGKVIGLIESHALASGGYCHGYIAWVVPSRKGSAIKPRHELVSGCPGEEDKVTISPSLQCTQCSSHGWIQDGKWRDA